jgi:hypothetical protein|eukprot:SAG25_NODE_25_length_21717_cov_29.421778_5_plen_83_part_00
MAARSTGLRLFGGSRRMVTARSLAPAPVSYANARTFAVAAPGTALPAVDMHLGFPPVKLDLAKYTAEKKVVLVGLPAAFTPT